MTWKEFTHSAVNEYCNDIGMRTFSLGDFYRAAQGRFAEFAPRNHHRAEKVRQTLQYLRDDGVLTFVDNRGTSTLRGVELLRDEVEYPELIKALPPDRRRREYLVEVFARDRGWVKIAKQKYGCYCLIHNCNNTFKTKAGSRYIEVHHIIALCDGGEDAIWNLSVLCAHHHRMAHFAGVSVRVNIRDRLLATTRQILAG